MNIKEVIDRGRYSIFSKMGDENRNKHIMIVNYIEQIASASSIDIGEWDLFEIFGANRGNNLITDKREINRRFFAKFREEKNSQPEEELTFEAAIQERLNDIARNVVGRQIQDLAIRKDMLMNVARRLSNQMNEKLTSAFALSQQINALSRRQPDIGAQIATIVAEGFWKYEGINEHNMLTMTTVGDVVCHHINKFAGIDIRVNLGKFRANLNLNNMTMSASAVDWGEDNIYRRAGLPCHPHVSNNICWGRSANSVHSMLAACELVDVFRIFANLLCDYCDENPYASICSYQDVFERNAHGDQNPEWEVDDQEEDYIDDEDDEEEHNSGNNDEIPF